MIRIKNILLVEDNLQDEELMLAALTEYNLADRVTVVRDGEQALDYLYRRRKFQMRAEGNPVVVLLDNKMPKVSGLQVLQTMKADDELKTIPVVALTSSRERQDLINFYRNGVNAYVVKPLDFSSFMETVKELVIFWTTINEPPPLEREKLHPANGAETKSKFILHGVNTPSVRPA